MAPQCEDRAERAMRSRERPRVSFKGHIESANRYYYLPVSLAQACIHMISGAHRHLRRF
jgi:hypothetical protein